MLTYTLKSKLHSDRFTPAAENEPEQVLWKLLNDQFKKFQHETHDVYFVERISDRLAKKFYLIDGNKAFMHCEIFNSWEQVISIQIPMYQRGSHSEWPWLPEFPDNREHLFLNFDRMFSLIIQALQDYERGKEHRREFRFETTFRNDAAWLVGLVDSE